MLSYIDSLATETEPSRLNPANPEKSNMGLNPKSLEIKSFTPENPCFKDIAIVFPPFEALAELVLFDPKLFLDL